MDSNKGDIKVPHIFGKGLKITKEELGWSRNYGSS
jgi:hypothetical protein